MATTTFAGPVVSGSGFNTSGTVSSTVLRAASATLTNLTVTSLNAGNLTIGTTVSAVSGVVTLQLGYVQVLVGATTAYVALYRSIVL